jgi:hypothetical protein
VIDEHAPHDASRDAEKVRAVLPVDVPGLRQAQERLIDQGSGLQGVSLPLTAHVGPSQTAQLRFNERHQALERAVIAATPRPQQLGDRPR